MATPIIHLHKREQKQVLLNAIKSRIQESTFGKPDFNQIAESLHMSSRSLRRHLNKHGLCYQDLIKVERKQIAIKLIKSGKYTLEQIGTQLGYKDASSFSRAFKNWHGVAPSTYQKHLQTQHKPVEERLIEVA